MSKLASFGRVIGTRFGIEKEKGSSIIIIISKVKFVDKEEAKSNIPVILHL